MTHSSSISAHPDLQPVAQGPSMKSVDRRRLLLWLGPPLLWFTAFMLIPYSVLIYYSVGSIDYLAFKPGFSMVNYIKVFMEDPYGTILLRSARVGMMTAVFSTILAYPLAFFMAFHIRSGMVRSVMYLLVILPWWASYLIKAYAWRTILGTNGILNSLLLYLGIVDSPVQAFLYNEFSVVMTLTYIFTPFAVLSIYASLERIPVNIIEAAKEAGATDWELFRRIVLPISIPGIIAGATITFSLGFGDFIAATLVGGSESVMIAGVVVNLMGVAFDWPLGAAIGVVVVAMALALMKVLNHFEHRATVRI